MGLGTCIFGFAVGFLVGLTGMGGGAVMTPALILLGWARPVAAVGTDLVWGAITKAVGSLAHFRQRNVDLGLVRRLAFGSIPGALAGVVVLEYVRRTEGEVILDRLVARALGVALICVALSLLVRSLAPRLMRLESETRGGSGLPASLTIITGGLVGFLVSMTSVGSGSLIVACLIFLYPRMPSNRIVGSDIFHGLLLVGAAGLGHWKLGSVNMPLLVQLSTGSIPGVWLGSRLNGVFPEKVLRPVLATTLFLCGYKLL